MKPYPHKFTAAARTRVVGNVVITAPALQPIATAAPAEFDGPGGTWSPETLLCAVVANCFVLTFRGLARAAHFNWTAIECRVEGTLEHVEDKTQFTRFATVVKLTVPPGAEATRARLLLGRAEYSCLIANSLRGERTLSTEIATDNAMTEPRDRPLEWAGEDLERRACGNGLRTGGGRL